jgi:hypothetical protein
LQTPYDMVVPNGGSAGEATSRTLDPDQWRKFSALGRAFVKPLVHAFEACLSSGLGLSWGRQGLGLAMLVVQLSQAVTIFTSRWPFCSTVAAALASLEVVAVGTF